MSRKQGEGEGRTTVKRWIVITAFLALVAARAAWPHVNIDGLSAGLISIAALLFLLPETRAVLPYIKRLKLFDVEIELREEIRQLGQDVEEAQRARARDTGLEVPAQVSSQIEQILLEAAKDPRAALLLLAAKLEQQIRERLQRHGLDTGRRFMPISKAAESGVAAGVFPPEVLPALRDFWAVRNKVAHGAAFGVEEGAIISLISLGAELLKVISADRQDGQEHP